MQDGIKKQNCTKRTTPTGLATKASRQLTCRLSRLCALSETNERRTGDDALQSRSAVPVKLTMAHVAFLSRRRRRLRLLARPESNSPDEPGRAHTLEPFGTNLVQTLVALLALASRALGAVISIAG